MDDIKIAEDNFYIDEELNVRIKFKPDISKHYRVMFSSVIFLHDLFYDFRRFIDLPEFKYVLTFMHFTKNGYYLDNEFMPRHINFRKDKILYTISLNMQLLLVC